jgi:hypothetical protein
MPIIRKSSAQFKQELQDPSKADMLRLEKVKNMKDKDIDFSDIPEITAEWLSQVKIQA